MKKHIIFGATGFIGSHVAQQLVKNGVSPAAVVRASSDTRLLESLGVSIIRLDRFEIETLSQVLSSTEVVYNCTANVHLHQSLQQYREIQVNLARNIALAAANANVRRLVQLSTVEVYGSTPDKFIDETYPKNPVFDLQQSMLEREQTLSEIAKQTGLDVVILRPAGTIGSRSPLFDMLASSHKKGIFPMIGEGDVTFSMVDTRDIGRAMALLGQSASVSGQTYLLKGYETTMQSIKKAFDRFRETESKAQKMPVALGKLLARLMVTFTPYGKTPMLTPFIIKNQTTPILIDDHKIRKLPFSPLFDFNDSIESVLSANPNLDTAPPLYPDKPIGVL